MGSRGDGKMEMNHKRGYYVNEIEEFDGIGVVATSVKEAKKIAFDNELTCDWIDMRVRWIKDADVNDLPVGIINDYKLGLKHGLFNYIEGTCDICGRDDVLEWVNEQALCSDCAEKESNTDRGDLNHTYYRLKEVQK